MCVLCGEPLTHLHWTEERPDAGAKTTMFVRDARDHHGERRRERLRRARLADRVLRLHGLKLTDPGVRGYVLSDAKGRSVLVADLGELWPAAERLLGRPLDPLDPTLLEALARDG